MEIYIHKNLKYSGQDRLSYAAAPSSLEISVANTTSIFWLFTHHIHYRLAAAQLYTTLTVRPGWMQQALRDLCRFRGRGKEAWQHEQAAKSST